MRLDRTLSVAVNALVLSFTLLLGVSLVMSSTARAAPSKSAAAGTSPVSESVSNGNEDGSSKAGSKETGPVIIVPMNTIILPGTESQFSRALAMAKERRAAAVVVELNTPGGVLQTTQNMTQEIFRSPVPVIVYVTPTGGSATSAGVFLTVAAHVAAMAPGTSIGAAHPVSGDGKDIEGDMRKKAENATAAMVRGLAERRGRNAEWVEKAVRDSVSITASEAVKERVVDFEAASLDEVLSKVAGKKVNLDGREVVLDALNTRARVVVAPSTKEQVINFLGHPNVAALLWLAATTGISIELYNPGLVFPGVVGVICLVLALAVSQIIPLNEGAILLFAVGALMIGIELIKPSFVLGIAGVAAMVAAALFLIDVDAAPGVNVSLSVILPTALLLGGLMMLTVTVVARALRRKVATGIEGMIGSVHTLDRPLRAGDNLLVEGELWKVKAIESAAPGVVLNAGEKVEIVGVDGLRLVVRSVS